MQKEPMTNDSYDELTSTLNDLKLVDKPKILIAIEEARQLGDLKENAEYHAEKEDQANINKRIADLDDIVTRAVVVDASKLKHDKISFGSTVVLIDLSDEAEMKYKIVGSLQSNP
jgi:transcription elongation factor GreA